MYPHLNCIGVLWVGMSAAGAAVPFVTLVGVTYVSGIKAASTGKHHRFVTRVEIKAKTSAPLHPAKRFFLLLCRLI